ncbi:MAG: hypothetical protein GY791_01590 [Alphaproteobacteria bacterium]|nr:hypothetical protein [Alphaproteobacteria bacterium]
MADEAQAVVVEAVTDKSSLDTFIRTPWPIYAHDSNWVPPLVLERRDHLDQRKNPFFDHAEAALWVARRGQRVVGRISAQIDSAYLKLHQDATGHFGLLEAEDDAQVFQALTGTAEAWLRDRGMRRVRGPLSLSINDESGLLVDGFDTPPMIMMNHAPPYYGAQLEAIGYAKAKDLIAYIYDSFAPMPKVAASLVERVRQSPEVTLRPLRKKSYDAELHAILDIFNDAWANNWGFVPLGEAEMAHIAKEMKPLIREDLVCIAEIDGVPAAMAVSLPNLNEAIADLDGALLPFGWAKLLWRLKVGSLKTARVALMGIRQRLQQTPMGGAIAFAVIDTIRQTHMKSGIGQVELSWVLEDNTRMRHMIEAVGGQPYKTYRIYERDLTAE